MKTRQLLENLFDSDDVDVETLRQAIRHHMSKGHDLETAKEMAWQQSDKFPKARPPRPTGHMDRIRAAAGAPPTAKALLMALPSSDHPHQ